MQIKKISDKLNFDVEAQYCYKHGYSTSKGGCNSDCKSKEWTSANYWHANFGGNTAGCKKETIYSCSFSCKR